MDTVEKFRQSNVSSSYSSSFFNFAMKRGTRGKRRGRGSFRGGIFFFLNRCGREGYLGQRDRCANESRWVEQLHLFEPVGEQAIRVTGAGPISSYFRSVISNRESRKFEESVKVDLILISSGY